MLAFFFKKVKGNAVFKSAVITQVLICLIFYFGNFSPKEQGLEPIISYLWLNFIGCILVSYFSLLFIFKSINKQSKITLIITSFVILKITYDILNEVSLNIAHVVSLIILFLFLGFFNFEKTIINDKKKN